MQARGKGAGHGFTGKVLRQLVSESLYVIDEVAIADAIVLRSSVRAKVPELPFRSASRGPKIRLLRRRNARSFH